MIKLSPSLLAADPMQLGAEIQKAAAAGCDELHFDVMDGHFVPNLTFGPHILKGIKRTTPLFCDAHLMLSDPLNYVDSFADAGADLIFVHTESNDWEAALRRIRERGILAGVSIKPGTGAETLREALPLIDRVLLMTVEPGFGGQKLMESALGKARELRAMGFRGAIEADGGINTANMQHVAESGVDILVMGTAFFGAEDPAALCRQVHAL